MRILIVDDEISLTTALQQLLKQHQYIVDVANDGTEGLDMAQAGIYDVLVVDVMLPGLSGYDVVRTLREDNDVTPIIMLTARGAEEDKVFGLDSGADDYMVKPFGVQELLARIRALTRRTSDSPTTVLGANQIVAGQFTLNFASRTVSCHGELVPLTSREFQLMELFMRNTGIVLPRHVLLDRVWGYDSEIDSNIVETYIHFLRKKLAPFESDGASSGPTIKTVHGVGYVYQPQPTTTRKDAR